MGHVAGAERRLTECTGYAFGSMHRRRLMALLRRLFLLTFLLSVGLLTASVPAHPGAEQQRTAGARPAHP